MLCFVVDYLGILNNIYIPLLKWPTDEFFLSEDWGHDVSRLNVPLSQDFLVSSSLPSSSFLNQTRWYLPPCQVRNANYIHPCKLLYSLFHKLPNFPLHFSLLISLLKISSWSRRLIILSLSGEQNSFELKFCLAAFHRIRLDHLWPHHPSQSTQVTTP